MFTPTEAQLLRRGFQKNAGWFSFLFETERNILEIVFWEISKEWQIEVNGESIQFYPTSIEDIDAIIRMFTPKD